MTTRSGDATRGLELDREILEILSEENYSIRSVIHLTMGGAYTLRCDHDSAIEYMRQASHLGIRGDNEQNIQCKQMTIHERFFRWNPGLGSS